MPLKSFVFDTSALISAHLSSNSRPAQAYDKALSLGDLVRSDDTFEEFATSFLRSKFNKYVSFNHRLEKIETYKLRSQRVEISLSINICRDPKDDKFLELAIAAAASCIITGDKDLLTLHPFRNIAILSPADFLKSF